MDDSNLDQSLPGPIPERRRKRIRIWTPDDRAAHRVFEKSRREAFNDGLIDLARRLPALASVRRLNKHMIVQESVSRHTRQHQTCLAAWHQIQALIAERDELLNEVNVWRSNNTQPLLPRQPLPVDTTLIRELSEADREIFGTFPNGFNVNPASEDQEGPTATCASNSDNKVQTGLLVNPQSQVQQVDLEDFETHNEASELVNWDVPSGFPDTVPPSLGTEIGHVPNGTREDIAEDIARPNGTSLFEMSWDHGDFLNPDVTTNNASGFENSLALDHSSDYRSNSYTDFRLYDIRNTFQNAAIPQF